MKSVAHQYEDKLLEFAYGELPQHEADAVDAHVRGCNRCAQSLSEIRGVRMAMAQLPMEPAPDAGLESLLAYAEQAAKRNAAEAKPAPSFFKRFLMPLASLAALVTVGVVGFRASQEFDTSPASAMADQKVAAVQEATKKNEEQKLQEASKAVAQTEMPPAQPAEVPADLAPKVAVPEVVAAVSPQPANKSPEAKNDDSRSRADGKDLAKEPAREKAKEGRAASDGWDDKVAAGKAGTKGDEGGAQNQWAPEPKASKPPPQSTAKRSSKDFAIGNDEQVYRGQSNYSDVGTRAAKMERQELAAKTPPPPPPAPPAAEDKPSFGLGTSSPGSGSAMGGASTRDYDGAPQGLSQGALKPSPAPTAPPAKAEPKPDPKAEKYDAYLAAKQREENEKVAATKEAESKRRLEEDRRAQDQERAAVAEPAPVAAAPSAAPSTSTYSQPYAPQKKSKASSGGYGIRPQLDSKSSAGEESFDDEALSQTDSVRLSNDAKYRENQQREQVTQSLEKARVSSSSGDRMGEIQLLKRALQSGAKGYEKAEALKRICDAYEALGEPETGDAYCNQLLREFPDTVAAKIVSDRRKAQVKRAAPAPKKPAANSERQLLDDMAAPKPAEAAPAQSY